MAKKEFSDAAFVDMLSSTIKLGWLFALTSEVRERKKTQMPEIIPIIRSTKFGSMSLGNLVHQKIYFLAIKCLPRFLYNPTRWVYRFFMKMLGK